MAPAALLNAAATNNLMVGNLLRGNAVNAYDSSDIVPTAEEFQRIFARFLFDTPGIAPGSPGSRGWMVQSYLSAFQPGMNRWDDGVHGNYYDDFDEPVEGFRDANRDGVGEAPRPIPGGRHVDRFPLSVERANSL